MGDAPSTGAKLHDKHARVAKIPKAFKLLDRPLIPSHKKYTKCKPVGHNNKIHVLGACLRPLEASHIYVRSKRFPKSWNKNSQTNHDFYVRNCTRLFRKQASFLKGMWKRNKLACYAIVNICSRFPIWKTVEETTVTNTSCLLQLHSLSILEISCTLWKTTT